MRYAFMANLTMDKLVALAKNRGFVFPGSEIYGGLANTWDYGPLGVELKNNIKKAWWKKFITESEYNVGLDCAILMNPKVWEASGHIGGFSDPLMDCKACKSRHRADDLIENWNAKKGITLNIAGWTNEQMQQFIADNNISIAVLCVPKNSVAGIIDKLYINGIKAFWNFSHFDIARKSSDTVVENVHMTDSLMTLSYRMNEKLKSEEKN